MTDKEVTDLFMEQIKSRDKIIEKLLEERVENRRINKWELVSILLLAFMMFLICITFILSYFFADYSITNLNTNNNNNTIEGGLNNGKK